MQLSKLSQSLFVAIYIITMSMSGFSEPVDTGYDRIVIAEFGSADVLKVKREIALPEPGPGEVRIKVEAVTVAFSDTMMRKGLFPGLPDLPFSPGSDMVGIVDKLGPDVGGFAVGQRVAELTFLGSYSEYITRQTKNLVPISNDLNAEAAVSLVGAYVTAYQMLHRIAEVKPGQTILIHGASGGVGSALSELGKLSGLKMYGTASTAKQDFVENMGVTPIDYKTEDFVERILTLTNNNGVDVVFDAIGIDNFKRSYKTLADDGQLVQYGFFQASQNAQTKNGLGVLKELLLSKWMNFKWNWFPNGGRSSSFYVIGDLLEENPDWFREDLLTLCDLLGGGELKPPVWKVLPLLDAAEAHRLFESHAVRGRIVLRGQ